MSNPYNKTANEIVQELFGKVLSLPIEAFRFEIAEDVLEADFGGGIIQRESVMDALADAMMNGEYYWFLILHRAGWQRNSDRERVEMSYGWNSDDDTISEYKLSCLRKGVDIRIGITQDEELLLGDPNGPTEFVPNLSYDEVMAAFDVAIEKCRAPWESRVNVWWEVSKTTKLLPHFSLWFIRKKLKNMSETQNIQHILEWFENRESELSKALERLQEDTQKYAKKDALRRFESARESILGIHKTNQDWLEKL